MPGKIIANRPEVSRSFAVLGFTIRTGVSPSWFEVALATDPQLFRPEAKTQRTPANFYSTRALGAMPAERGEAVYLAPPEVLDRFVGQPRLYYMLATFRQPDLRDPEITWMPAEIAPYVTISKSFTGSPRRIDGTNSRRAGNGYGQQGNALEWAGDQATPGQMEPVSLAPAAAGREVRVGAPGSAPASSSLAPAAVASSYDIPYDDGLDTSLWRMLEQTQAEETQDDVYGIEGPIPDVAPVSKSQAYSRSLDTSAYPQTSRFEPANPSNYRASSSPRTIDKIVIHITDGGPNINGTISWFKNPSAQVSAHYIVGQDGEVVQMVHHNDVAWHAHRANSHSIGIEHVANTRGLMPTEAQYCASAGLVTWLCDQYSLPLDRIHILGHAEADPNTTHQQCPNAVWNWEYYMGLVTSRSCYPMPQAVAAGQSYQLPARVTAPKYYGNRHGNGNGKANGNGHRNGQPYAAQSGLAGSLAEVDLIYRPADGADALGLIQEFNNRHATWAAGVPDTSFYPHSGICKLRIETTRSPTGWAGGTGFYISNDRILTAAHNLMEATSVTVIPGLNGDLKPFGEFTVSPDRWHIHPSYSGSHDYDLAVIMVDRPGPWWFDRLEELRESLPSPIVVCGYAGVTVDNKLQHMDADRIHEVTDNTFRYNLQTQKGTSGSPVFYVWTEEDEQERATVLRSIVVGVHVGPHDSILNTGCRLTDEKIRWIWSVVGNGTSGAQSLGYGRSALRQMAPAAPLSTEIPLDPGTGGMSISTDALQHGDIIVSTTTETVSDVIRRASNAPVSHAMLYVGDGLVVEAIGSGVVLRPLAEAIQAASLAVAFRVQDATYEQAMLARDFAGQQIGRPYNYWGIARLGGFLLDRATWCSGKSGGAYDRCVNWVGRINLGRGSDDSFFCSQLVLDAYVHAGVPLTRTPPHWNSPGDIADLRMDGRLGYVGHLKAEVVASQGLGLSHNGSRRTARGLNVPAAVEIGNMVITHVLGNEGDVSWELDQGRGMKHVRGDPNNAGSGPVQERTIRVNGPVRVKDLLIYDDRIYFNCDVNFQYDGRSVGNVTITPIENSDAPAMGLRVTARLMDDDRTYTRPPDPTTVAALKIQFVHQFTETVYDDTIRIVDMIIFGNGDYSLQHRR